MQGTARPRSPSPRRSSLLAKLKAPFGSKPRNIPEFYIQPDDPHRQYAPGDLVTGSVVLKISKPVRITHLVVCLHAYVHVYKTPNTPGEGYKIYSNALAQGKTRKGGGYYGNGIASLFEDEVVLCGDGRLGEGTYQFNYELELPRDRLPSSIDFERGNITYLVTSTLTRPTAIAPTMSCDSQIQFQERIDIAALLKPKPRVISLEPIVRRGRPRRQVTTSGVENGSKDSERTSGDSASVGMSIASSTTINADQESPQSPPPSRRSRDSDRSSGGNQSAIDSNSISGRTGDSFLGGSRHASSQSQLLRAITTKIELQQAGYLRGDNINIKITVNHTKPVKSLHGIIVTFYRQARVDYQPSLVRVNSGKGEDDEAVPKSRTGLGGLSFTSSNSSHLFRKDLSQSFASLIINPNTLSADVRATVRVPEHAFPTISCVPGAMISFKYYVEVVLDLQNKLAGLDRFLPNAGMSGVSTQASANLGAADASHSVFAPWGGHCIDTEEIKRDKSVVACVFEVVIGTKDSERKSRWKQPAEPATPAEEHTEQWNDGLYEASGALRNDNSEIPSYAGHTPPASAYHINGQDHDRDPSMSKAPVPPDEPPPSIHAAPYPPPAFAAEDRNLSEKERLRQAEERLLPSRPPEDDAGPSTGVSMPGPSASDLYSDDSLQSEAPPDPYTPSAPPLHAIINPQTHFNVHHTYQAGVEAGPSAPAYDGLAHNPNPANDSHRAHTAAGSGGPTPTDDKQELQRILLESQRSAPPLDEHSPGVGHVNGSAEETTAAIRQPTLPIATDPTATDPAAGSTAPAGNAAPVDIAHTPSAPTMEELSLGFSTTSQDEDAQLPKYER